MKKKKQGMKLFVTGIYFEVLAVGTVFNQNPMLLVCKTANLRSIRNFPNSIVKASKQ